VNSECMYNIKEGFVAQEEEEEVTAYCILSLHKAHCIDHEDRSAYCNMHYKCPSTFRVFYWK
jgi:hypothetical protein